MIIKNIPAEKVSLLLSHMRNNGIPIGKPKYIATGQLRLSHIDVKNLRVMPERLNSVITDFKRIHELSNVYLYR